MSIAAGITVGLIASLVQSLGITIQRKSHILNEQLPIEEQRVERRRPLWLLGFAIFISSNILGSLFQIASLPVLILAPLGAVSLLWNAFFARFILGDVFNIYLALGTILIAGGAVLIAVFGIVDEPTHSLEDLLALFRRPQFITYFSLLGAGVFICLVITHVAEISFGRRLRLTPPPTPPPMSPTAENTETTPLLSSHKNTENQTALTPKLISRTRTLLAISYSSISGIISGMCLLFAKSGIELLLLTINGKNQFWRWESWMLLLGLGVFALLQLWYLHKSLILADPTLVCPLAFCFYNISCILNSLVYYNQFALLPTTHLLLVLLGTIVLLGGVWSVSIKTGDRPGIDFGTFHEGEETAEMALIDGVDEEEHPPLVRASHSLPPRLPSELLRARSQGRNATAPSPLIGISEEQEDVTSPTEGTEQAVPEVHLSSSQIRPKPTGHRRRRSTLLSPTFSSSQMQSQLLLPAGGLSIGLSPISPGFALVPRRTLKMRVPDVVRQLRMRRTLSDSDIHSGGVTSVDLGQHRTDPTDLENQRDQIQQTENNVPRRTRERWRWLKAIVRKGGD